MSCSSKWDNFQEDWGLLDIPGKNGVISLIAALMGWGMAIGSVNGRSQKELEKDTADWVDAVEDVKFMLDGLCASLATSSWVERLTWACDI